MADNKTKREPLPKFVSPKGTFKYPRLNEPDYGNDDYPIEGGAFSTRLVLSAADAKPLIDKLTPIHAKAVEEGEAKFKELKVDQRKKLKEVTVQPFFTELYDEDEKPTGEVEFRFKMKHSGVNKKTQKKWSRKPTIFDAKGQPMKNPPNIWGGTEGKVSFEARPYWVAGQAMSGISLSLNAVQIISLVSGGGGSAEDHGFGEEDGYEYDPEDAPATEKSSGTDSNGGEEEDF